MAETRAREARRQQPLANVVSAPKDRCRARGRTYGPGHDPTLTNVGSPRIHREARTRRLGEKDV